MKKKYHYCWKHNNKSELLVDGNKYFPEMLNSINNASKFILLEIYLFESGSTCNQFIEAFINARQRNVEIYLILDHYGTKKLTKKNTNKLTRAGCHIATFNPFALRSLPHYLKRDHRKLLIIDEEITFIGGAGITDEFNPEYTPDYWHDIMLKTTGPVTRDWINVFFNTWEKYSPVSIPANNFPADTIPEKVTSKARVLIAEGTERHEVNRALVKRIRNSKNQVWLTSPYFVSIWKIRRSLRYAARNGRDVRLIFPGTQSDHTWISVATRRYYSRLLNSGVKIFEYQPRFTHSKIVICDDWVTIGSSNFDRWNQYLNLDANIEIIDPELHKSAEDYFANDFKHSREITLHEWKNRSTTQRIKEFAIGFIIALLGSISWKYRRR